MTQKIKAVAYYRMSSDKQETSIADQRTAVEEFAVKLGYKIIREYLDEGISGWKSEQRKGFQRLIEDANKGEFAAVLCWDQDRFSRFPVLEANHYWYLLDRAGVHITTVAQGRLNFEDLGEWLKASVVQHGKAEYVRDLGRNTARGLRTLKLAGRWLGCAPLGYQLVDGRLQMGDRSEIATVRRVFDMRASGYGFYRIARALNEDGTPTMRAATWHAKSVRHLLQNDVYVGHTVVGRQARGKYGRVVDEATTIENTHPAIIDQQTWQAVQGMFCVERRAHGRRGGEGAPLAGLVKCGRCGQPMYACETAKYVCSSYKVGGTCGHCTVRREPLLSAVAAKIRQHVLMGSRTRLEAAIQRQLDRRRAPRDDSKEAERKLATLDRQIERAGDRLLAVDDSLVAELEKRLLAMKRQRAELAASIEAKPTAKPLPSAKAIAAKIWELDRILSSASATAVRHALAQLIDHIRLDFVPAGEDRRGKRYAFSGGVIQLHTQAQQHGTAL